MDDLRTDEQKNKDEKSWTPNKKSVLYTGNIPSRWYKIKRVLIKAFKKSFKFILIFGTISLLLLYPYEIGTFIGDWAHAFWTGLSQKF